LINDRYSKIFLDNNCDKWVGCTLAGIYLSTTHISLLNKKKQPSKE